MRDNPGKYLCHFLSWPHSIQSEYRFPMSSGLSLPPASSSVVTPLVWNAVSLRVSLGNLLYIRPYPVCFVSLLFGVRSLPVVLSQLCKRGAWRSPPLAVPPPRHQSRILPASHMRLAFPLSVYLGKHSLSVHTALALYTTLHSFLWW